MNIVTAGYTQAQIDAITTAFNNWEGVGGVSFAISYNSTSIPAGAQGTYTVNSAYTAGSVNADTPGPLGSPTYQATTTLNTAVTNPASITNVMAHEIGHTFGLDDDDSNTDTVMADACDMRDDPANCGKPGPTPADAAAATCEDGYTGNVCMDPGNSDAVACQCGAGTSGDCSGGLTCGANGQDGVCGCTDSCDDPNCEGYDDLACNCPDNECYSEACSDWDYCTCYPDECSPSTCDPTDYDECDPNSCYYDYWQCFVDCGCEDFCGDLQPVIGAPSDRSTPVDADPNLLVPQRTPTPSVKPHPMCEVQPRPSAPQTAARAIYVSAVKVHESSIRWRTAL